LKSIIKEIQLPNDRDLLMELSTRQWKQDVRGKRCIESKADYKKRGYRSPDIADACIIAYYRPQKIEPMVTII
jgi:phage terminase large subunit